MKEWICVVLDIGRLAQRLLGRAADFARAVHPRMTARMVADVAAFRAKAVADRRAFVVDVLVAVERAPREESSQLRDRDAVYLIGEDMPNAFLLVGDDVREPPIETLHNLAQEDAALGERIEESRLRAPEKLLRQKVQHLVDHRRRREHLVRTEVGEAVQYVRTYDLDLTHSLIPFINVSILLMS